MCEIVERYYPKYYTVDQVKVFVERGKITEAQFLEITGETYLVE
ncbi:XkdX family protein [Chengkuizengella marina]|uniref:XkdX family protein n=1 Tax=Chengkuizengella marina TaxID=2507566 RepID=A0A6N9Q8N5_9BACL|nr:XkdX family protein [Chengkuizengella marina]NBI31238.1 XkdX family protein [Chengkuizengella marina]